MKLFLKILLFVFVALIVNVNVISAAITFSNILEATTSFPFHGERSETVVGIIENDLANCCQNGRDLVDYRNWVTSLEAMPLRRVQQLYAKLVLF